MNWITNKSLKKEIEKEFNRFNGNGNNDGSLGGALTMNNFIADPYIAH